MPQPDLLGKYSRLIRLTPHTGSTVFGIPRNSTQQASQEELISRATNMPLNIFGHRRVERIVFIPRRINSYFWENNFKILFIEESDSMESFHLLFLGDHQSAGHWTVQCTGYSAVPSLVTLYIPWSLVCRRLGSWKIGTWEFGAAQYTVGGVCITKIFKKVRELNFTLYTVSPLKNMIETSGFFHYILICKGNIWEKRNLESLIVL